VLAYNCVTAVLPTVTLQGRVGENDALCKTKRSGKSPHIAKRVVLKTEIIFTRLFVLKHFKIIYTNK